MYMETRCPQCGWLLWKNHLGDVLYCHCGWSGVRLVMNLMHRCQFHSNSNEQCQNPAVHFEPYRSGSFGGRGLWLCEFCLPKAKRLWKRLDEAKVKAGIRQRGHHDTQAENLARGL